MCHASRIYMQHLPSFKVRQSGIGSTFVGPFRLASEYVEGMWNWGSSFLVAEVRRQTFSFLRTFIVAPFRRWRAKENFPRDPA